MLERPWLTPLVIAFWLVTTGWLVIAKILPSFVPGAPPGFQAHYIADSKPIPVGWTVFWNDQPLGWAVADTRRTGNGGLVVDSRVHCDALPLHEIIRGWTRPLLRQSIPDTASISLDARGQIMIDPAGKLRSFGSTVRVPGSEDLVVLYGTVHEGEVTVTVRTGAMQYETRRHFPEHMMIGDELSPQATLPGLYEGREWTMPIYSPLRGGGAPIEVLYAHVGPEEHFFWENQLRRVHVVSYHEDPSSPREPRSRVWVDIDGRVLKQEASVLGAKLAFVRRSDESAAHLATFHMPPAAPSEAPGSSRTP